MNTPMSAGKFNLGQYQADEQCAELAQEIRDILAGSHESE